MGSGEVLEGLMPIALAEGHPERSGRLIGAAAALREAIGNSMPPNEREDYERSKAAVQAALGEEKFRAARTVGSAMNLAQAVAYALEEEARQEPPQAVTFSTARCWRAGGTG